MDFDMRKMATFGVAGNFTGHLEQAGEASDFVNVKTAEAKAPKAIFPTYIPAKNPNVPAYLTDFPFDSQKILYPIDQDKIQIEPECAIIADIKWEGDIVTGITPVAFGASNDCSIRREGAKKISIKKNWGESSKGLSDNCILMDKFSPEGNINDYRIASFMVRDGEVYPYGEDSAVRDYSYVYDKLILWMMDKFNNQKDEGPAEDINSYLLAAGKPEQFMISIGATRYTEFGEKNFLKIGDHSVVVLYPETDFSFEQITEMVRENSYKSAEISVLDQVIVAL